MLQIDEAAKLQLDISSFVGHSAALLGITGSGKTNTAAVLIEELLGHGLPMTIVDIEGEYWGLKQQYDLLIAGRSEHAELLLGPENAAQLAEVSVQRGISVILDLSEYTQEEAYEFLVAYFKRLWEVASATKQPYQIVLEEAHEFVPQGANTPLKQLLTRIALRGRKRGLGIILISQRSAKVEKDVLTQTSLLFLHKVVHPIDMKVYKDLIPLPGTQVEEMVASLQTGQAVVISQHIPQVAQIRLRSTFHAGITPTLGAIVEPELRHIDAEMLRELQTLMQQKRGQSEGNSEARQAKRIQELEALIAAKDAEIVRLQERIAILSALSMTVESPESLAISHASVDTMHVSGRNHTTVVESLPVEKHVVATTTKGLASPLNERKFANLVSRIAQLPKRQRLTLQVLTEQGRSMSLRELAAWLNIEESSLSKNPPSDLLRLKLLRRERYNDGFHYQSALRNYLECEYPGIEVDKLVQRLF